MLNAFRHQRNSHPMRQCWRCITMAVLNAFRHQRNSHPGSCKAQRFASAVLNAFRHQRNSHYKEANERKKVSCAQRLSASKELSQTDADGETQINKCSTPFGIKGTLTPAIAKLYGEPNVLNAFRHQRNSHQRRQEIEVEALKCSTPFGIKGTLTYAWIRGLGGMEKCSTPFGIKGTLTKIHV